jgi:hypothetical protein
MLIIMKPIRLYIGILTALGGLALPGMAHAGQANGRAEIAVLRNLSFIKIDDLEFGNIIAGPAAGTVTISPFVVRTTTGPVTVVGGGFQQAQFGGRGTTNQNLQISMTTNTVTLRRSAGPQTMIANAFIIGSTPTQPLTTTPRLFRITSSTGVFQFGVGRGSTSAPIRHRAFIRAPSGSPSSTNSLL